jgi:hypothetical protein
MSNEENKPATTRLREGYQGSNPEQRGYQGTVDKGYQPTSQLSVSQPPAVGTTTVIPVQNPSTASVQSGTESKK